MALTLPKGLVNRAYRVRAAVGFTHNHAFLLWFLCTGAMLGFCLSRLPRLDFRHVYCAPTRPGGGKKAHHAAPGECFWYATDAAHRAGVQAHLYAMVPAGLLACAQFVPAIRRRWTPAHRANGYLVLLLSAVGVAGAVVIAPVAFGGDLSVRGQVGAIAVMFLGSLAVAYYFIRRRRIDQHRAWMLRAWFYAGSIVTVRLVMSAAARIVSAAGDGKGGYYATMPCRQLASYMDAAVLASKYPACGAAVDDAWVLVKADLEARSPEQISAALSVSFGMALWMAFLVHAVGVEFYLQLTPGESKRLRELSMNRAESSD